MIKLCKAIIGYCCAMLCKRGELRDKDVLLASKLSSSIRISEFLSSRVLLLKFRLKSYSDLFRVSMDPRVKPEGDERRKSTEGDSRESVPEGDNSLLSSLRAVTRGQAIFELGKSLTPVNFLLAKRRVIGIVLSLFLLFPFSSYSAVYFLPDAQWDAPMNVSIDSSQCEEAGYTYYKLGVCPAYHNQDTCVFNDKYLKCDATGWCKDNGYSLSSCTSPKTLTTQCPSNATLYKSCVCPSTYKYVCTGTGYSSGNGTSCDNKYTKCTCATNYEWSGSACVCENSFKYTCKGTGYSSGKGTACGGKYKECTCSSYYSWNGSACVHTHSYVCPSGYSTSSSGMTNPISADKTCACGEKSGTCYKEGHIHSYSCPSGSYSSSSSCSGGSETVSKTCSCGSRSGTCYKCCSTSYKYSCSGTGYHGGSYSACGGKYPACTCSAGYYWTGSACTQTGSGCSVGAIYYSDGSCSENIDSGKTAIGVVVKNNSLIMGLKSDYRSYSSATAYCNAYSTTGTSSGSWYLPSLDEAYHLHNNYYTVSSAMSQLGKSIAAYIWTSTSDINNYAWILISKNTDGDAVDSKTNNNTVYCFRGI